MLTSPVNVAIALNGAPLKPHAAPSDPNARKEQPPLASPAPAVAPDMVIEPELPSNSPMTSVTAVVATAGNRTVLQELSLNLASMLKVARRQDESLTSLFLRIIAAIEKMPQAERLHFEIRSGLKGLKITLADLATALRRPDGPEAARLTAMAEAPSAVPGRTSVSAATSTYLQEGTADGHAEETLAMRAAARSSAAGQNVFTAESRIRPAEAQPTDGKVLQDQLKTMFETGASKETRVVDEGVAEVSAEVGPDDVDREQELQPSAADDIAPDHRPGQRSGRETVAISTSNLRLDPQALARIRTAAQAIADGLPEVARGDREQALVEKADPVDRRPTLLTLKGLVEAVTAFPAKAVEVLAPMPAETAVPAAEAANKEADPIRSDLPLLDEEALPELATMDERPSEQSDMLDVAMEAPHEAQADEASALPVRTETQKTGEKGPPPAEADMNTPPRLDLALHAVPFAHAPVPPARDEVEDALVEEDARPEHEEGAEEDSDDDGEQRRPRDEYDAIHDPAPDEEPALVINRDSSESDRAFALYQRMGGF